MDEVSGENGERIASFFREVERLSFVDDFSHDTASDYTGEEGEGD